MSTLPDCFLQLDRTRDLRGLTVALKYPLFATAPGRAFIETRGYESSAAFRLMVDSDGASLATIADADALLYFVSLATKAHNTAGSLPELIPYRPNAILKFLGRSLGGRQCQLLDEAIRRLSQMHIISDGEAYESMHLSSILRVRTNEADQIMSVTLAPWIIQHACSRRVLKLDPGYFGLRGLEKRIYGWCRACIGVNTEWRITELRAFEKSTGFGLTDKVTKFRKFRHDLRRLCQRDPLPHYTLRLVEIDRRNLLICRPREGSVLTANSEGDASIITGDAGTYHLCL